MDHQRHSMGSLQMGWLMVVGCMLPLGLLALFFIFDLPLSTLAVGGLILIGPLSHLVLMRYMDHGERRSSEPER